MAFKMHRRVSSQMLVVWDFCVETRRQFEIDTYNAMNLMHHSHTETFGLGVPCIRILTISEQVDASAESNSRWIRNSYPGA